MKQLFTSIFILSTVFTVSAQETKRTLVKGRVIAKDNDVEGVTVYNTSSNKGTITNAKGKFSLKVALNDILEFSAVQYKKVSLKITQKMLDVQVLKVNLNEQVNELEEVVVGKILTGNLENDIKVYDVEPDINFYDVDIPGYKGKPKTQSERRLYTATTGGGLIPFIPLINAISGRTKRLKEHVRVERLDNLLQSIISRMGNDFLSSHNLEEDQKMDFFYFCSEDPEFEKRCKGKSDFEIFEFLIEKHNQYQENLKSDKK